MQIAIGIILLISFFAFIYYCAKGYNLMMGLFGMAVLWSILGAIAGVVDWNTINKTIFNDGPVGFGPTAIYIVFGSWFGSVLVETGIAGTLIRRSVELGGERPSISCILLCIVTALIFTSAYGAGAVVAIGVIVFPIMFSLGISKSVAAAAFSMSVGCGLYFNQSLLTQAANAIPYPMIDGVAESGHVFFQDFQKNGLNILASQEKSAWNKFAIICFAIHLAFIIFMVILGTKNRSSRPRKAKAWAMENTSANKNVNIVACITPIMPVCLSIFAKLQMIPAIIISVIWAFAWTGNLKNFHKIADLVQKTFYNGVKDVGLVLAFLVFLQMFVKAAGCVKDPLTALVGGIIPQNTFVLFLVFGLLGFLALFRGPLTIWGAGVATFIIVAQATKLPMAVLYPLFYIPCCTVTTNVCPTQSWNTWAIGYAQVTTKDFMKWTLPYALPCAFILEMIAWAMFAR